MWWLLPSAEPGRWVVNRAMQEAQATVEAAAGDPGLVEQSRKYTEQELSRTLEMIGWRITFAE